MKIAKGQPVRVEDLCADDYVRVWFADDMEEMGGYWWYAQVVDTVETMVLQELDYDYTGNEQELYDIETFSENRIERLRL